MKQLFLSVLFLLLPILANAYDAQIDGIYYNLNSESKTAAVTNCNRNYSGEVVIPESVKYKDVDYSVTSIEAKAFVGRIDLTSVTIGNGVTTIGVRAFADCIGLTSVTIGNGVTTIDSSAFSECSGLTFIEIPNSVTTIGNFAFAGCSGLTSVTIPNSVTTIGSSAFSFCSDLTSIIVEADNSIYDSRGNCNAIIKTEDNELILGCKNTVIPNSVTSIGSGAFNGCSGLTFVTIPNSVTTIGSGAFAGCIGLTSVTIPNSVTSIGSSAFGECIGLTSIEIPSSVTSIDDWAFRACINLSYIEIPNSVTHIGGYAFHNTPWLNNQPDGMVYVGKVAYQYKGEMPANTEIIIKEGTSEIADGAFYGYSGLTSVIIPNSVTTIGSSAFYDCIGLTSMTVSNGVTSIGENAFNGCSNLVSIVIPNSVSYVGLDAFHNTPWLNNQPDGMVYVGKVAYQYKGKMPENTEIYIKEGTTEIVERLFYGCSGLTSIAIPNSVTYIGAFAFWYCTNLTDIYCYAKEVPEWDQWGDFPLYNSGYAITTLHVPARSVNAYNANDLYLWVKEIVPIYETSGDANCDGEIDLVDIVAMTNAIIGKPHVTYNPGVIDLNDDGEVDIFDVMLAISLVLNNNATARSMTRATGNTEEQAMLMATDNGVMLGVNEPDRFTAFQFDVEVADGVELTKIRLTDVAANHTLHFIKNGRNTYRVVVISLDNSTLADNGNGLVELLFSKSGHVHINNIVFVTPQETKAYFASGDAIVTGIDNIGYGQAERVFDLSGRKVDADYSRLSKGVYIIDNKKVVIK